MSRALHEWSLVCSLVGKCFRIGGQVIAKFVDVTAAAARLLSEVP